MEDPESIFSSLLDGHNGTWTQVGNGSRSYLLHDVTTLSGDLLLDRMILLSDRDWLGEALHKFYADGEVIFEVIADQGCAVQLHKVGGKKARKWTMHFRETLTNLNVYFDNFLRDYLCNTSNFKSAEFHASVSLLFKIAQTRAQPPLLTRQGIARVIMVALQSRSPDDIVDLIKLLREDVSQKHKEFAIIMHRNRREDYLREQKIPDNWKSEENVRELEEKIETYGNKKLMKSQTTATKVNENTDKVGNQQSNNVFSEEIETESCHIFAKTHMVQQNSQLKDARASPKATKIGSHSCSTSGDQPKTTKKRASMSSPVPSSNMRQSSACQKVKAKYKKIRLGNSQCYATTKSSSDASATPSKSQVSEGENASSPTSSGNINTAQQRTQGFRPLFPKQEVEELPTSSSSQAENSGAASVQWQSVLESIASQLRSQNELQTRLLQAGFPFVSESAAKSTETPSNQFSSARAEPFDTKSSTGNKVKKKSNSQQKASEKRRVLSEGKKPAARKRKITSEKFRHPEKQHQRVRSKTSSISSSTISSTFSATTNLVKNTVNYADPKLNKSYKYHLETIESSSDESL